MILSPDIIEKGQPYPSGKYLEAWRRPQPVGGFVADIGSGRSPSAHYFIYWVGDRRSPATLKNLGLAPRIYTFALSLVIS